ncbi:MAG: hypothetical protein Q8R28_02200 [Dehalococcoidia bacterium]|nr:hypothetical protein [Dehalococcoidia bacterium]
MTTAVQANEAMGILAALSRKWEAENTSPKQIFQRLRFVLLDEITDVEKAVGDAKAMLGQYKDHLQILEAELLQGVEGKNAEERKASLLLACDAHEGYQAVKSQMGLTEGVLLDREVALSRLNREWSALRLQMQLRIAQINFIGG